MNTQKYFETSHAPVSQKPVPLRVMVVPLSALTIEGWTDDRLLFMCCNVTLLSASTLTLLQTISRFADSPPEGSQVCGLQISCEFDAGATIACACTDTEEFEESVHLQWHA